MYVERLTLEICACSTVVVLWSWRCWLLCNNILSKKKTKEDCKKVIPSLTSWYKQNVKSSVRNVRDIICSLIPKRRDWFMGQGNFEFLARASFEQPFVSLLHSQFHRKISHYDYLCGIPNICSLAGPSCLEKQLETLGGGGGGGGGLLCLYQWLKYILNLYQGSERTRVASYK